MRKNGVNRELSKIDGGICAPAGFKASGVHAGFTQNCEKKDLTLIVADRACPTACVFSETSLQSGPATMTKKHLKRGSMRAILVNSGVANVCMEGGDILAEKVCRALALKAGVDANETVIASTGEIGKPIRLETFEKAIPDLVKNLSYTAEGSKAAAEGIAAGEAPKEFSYQFKLGDIVCKIGGIFKGGECVYPNAATTLAFLTTDVAISSEMLHKALSSAVKDTFDLLCVEGISSPNDIVCIMANGRAGNYKISCADTEYTKFAYVLKEVLAELCRRIALGDEDGCVFCCKVTGARSKQSARKLAKSVVSSFAVRQGLSSGALAAETLAYIAISSDERLRCEGMRVDVNGVVLFEGGRKFSLAKETLQALLEGREIELAFSLGEGNYSATAVGRLP